MNKDKAYIVNNAKLLANPEEPVMEEHKLQREFIDVLKSKGELDKFEAYLKTEFPTTMSVLEYCNLFAPSHWWITSENSWNAYIVQYHPEAIKPEVNIFAENSIWPALSTHIDSVAAPNISESTTITFKGGGSIARADCEFVDFKGVYRIDEPSEEKRVPSDPDRAKRSWLMQAEMKKKGRPEKSPMDTFREYLESQEVLDKFGRIMLLSFIQDSNIDFPIEEDAWSNLKIHAPVCWVKCAFEWEKSGDARFWEHIHARWVVICRANKWE